MIQTFFWIISSNAFVLFCITLNDYFNTSKLTAQLVFTSESLTQFIPCRIIFALYMDMTYQNEI